MAKHSGQRKDNAELSQTLYTQRKVYNISPICIERSRHSFNTIFAHDSAFPIALWHNGACISSSLRSLGVLSNAMVAEA
jgi:hypothetical protein